MQILKDFSFERNLSRNNFKICPPSKNSIGSKFKIKIIRLTKIAVLFLLNIKIKIKIKLEKQPEKRTTISFKKGSCCVLFMLNPKTFKEICFILTEKLDKASICDNSWKMEETK